MISHGMRALFDEPRPAHPPVRVWRDWGLLGVVVTGSVVEVVLRDDRAWLSVAVVVSGVIALSLLWRRTRPLAAVSAAFGTLIAFELVRIAGLAVTGLVTIAATLVLPYALLRWGSGREAVNGLGIVLVWLGVTHVADPTSVAEVVAGYAFFLFSAALGAAIRFHAASRLRDIEQAKLRQRNDFARDLHDTIGHHVSGIVVQAQAGQALAASQPDRALAVLATIEDAASRALEEMRGIVGVLRDDANPDLAPRPGLHDIEQLVRTSGPPRVEVLLAGTLDDRHPSVDVALYRIAQEAVTNALRHARNATRVTIEVVGDVERVRLSVSDDGDPVTASHSASGFGIVGMYERVSLLGGSIHAGPGHDRGWVVEVSLPRRGTAAVRPATTERSV